MNTAAVDALADAQHRLLHALRVPSASRGAQNQQGMPAGLDLGHLQAQRGWLVYRANAQATARRTLAAAYPVITALLGDDTLARVAHDLWQKHPPARGDLALWGADLPQWLADCDDLSGLPYLTDVARTEWALHLAASAADAPVDTTSFVRLTQEDPSRLTLLLAPGTAVLHSRFPVVSIIDAHRPDGPDFATAAQRLRSGVAECALVWRQGLVPRLAACDAAAAALVAALLRGIGLLLALEEAAAMDEGIPFDFSLWLQHAVSTGLVVGVGSLESDPCAMPQALP